MEEKADLINQSISDKGVCTTAPATRGLLITLFLPNLFFISGNKPLVIRGWRLVFLDKSTISFILVRHGFEGSQEDRGNQGARVEPKGGAGLPPGTRPT